MFNISFRTLSEQALCHVKNNATTKVLDARLLGNYPQNGFVFTRHFRVNLDEIWSGG